MISAKTCLIEDMSDLNFCSIRVRSYSWCCCVRFSSSDIAFADAFIERSLLVPISSVLDWPSDGHALKSVSLPKGVCSSVLWCSYALPLNVDVDWSFWQRYPEGMNRCTLGGSLSGFIRSSLISDVDDSCR